MFTKICESTKNLHIEWKIAFSKYSYIIRLKKTHLISSFTMKLKKNLRKKLLLNTCPCLLRLTISLRIDDIPMPTNVKNREMDGTFPYLHCKQSTTLPLNQNFVFFLTQNINIHMLFKCNIYVNSCIRFDKHEKDLTITVNWYHR